MVDMAVAVIVDDECGDRVFVVFGTKVGVATMTGFCTGISVATCLQAVTINTRATIKKVFGFMFLNYQVNCPTAGVTRWWAGRDNATLPEPT